MTVAHLCEAVRDVVAEEREVVAARLEALRDQAQRLHDLVEKVDADVEENARLLRQMDEILGLAPQLSLDAHDALRGRRLREIAVEVLRREKGIDSVVHYREWYELLLAVGLRVAGKDPVATFLTQIARAPGVESVRPRSGLYRLRAV